MKLADKVVLISTVAVLFSIALSMTWGIAVLNTKSDAALTEILKLPSKHKQLEQYSFIAQIDSAKYAFYQMILSACAIVISGAGFFFLYKSIGQTSLSLELSERFGESQTDAYPILEDVCWIERNKLYLKLKNFGTTPALNVDYTTTYKIDGFGNNHDDHQFNTAHSNRCHISHIAPGDTLTTILDRRALQGVDLDLIEAQRAQERIVIQIEMTVNYDTINGKSYHSEFAYSYDFHNHDEFEITNRPLPVHKRLAN